MTQNNIVIYGADWCDDSQRAKQFMEQRSIQFDWVDIETDEEAREVVERVNNGKCIIPTIIFQDSSILVEPSNAALARKLDIHA